MAYMMGMILANESEQDSTSLFPDARWSSPPFAGRYRLIDFMLSNMVNSDIDRVGVLPVKNYRSLLDHLGSAKDWDLNRKRGGLQVLPPYFGDESVNHGTYDGKIDALNSVELYLRKADEEYVVVANSNIICNMDLSAVLDFHMDKKADVTIVCARMNTAGNGNDVMFLTKDQDGKAEEILIESSKHPGRGLIGLNIYILKRSLLIRLVHAAHAKGYENFERDILQKQQENLELYCYEFDGYCALIDDVASYFSASMSMLDMDVKNCLFGAEKGTVFTKIKDSAPAMYGPNAKVINSMVADGCVIDGTVENSIIFRDARIEKGAHIKNSIIMQDTHIEQDVQLNYVITDKNVQISAGRIASGFASFPVVVPKSTVL